MAGLLAISDFGNSMVVLLGVLCLVMLSISMLRRSYERQTTQRDLSREQLARLRDQKEIRVSMEELMVQLEEVARRVNAQIDTRFVKLETIIQDADQRIAHLRQLARDAETPAPKADAPPPAEEFAPGLATAEAPEPRPATGRASEPARSAAPAVEKMPQTREERFQRVYGLADQGTPAIGIADALNLPLGEVELILRMRKFPKK